MTQFLRDQPSDSVEVVKALMLDGTYLSRNFATLGPLFQPPYVCSRIHLLFIGGCFHLLFAPFRTHCQGLTPRNEILLMNKSDKKAPGTSTRLLCHSRTTHQYFEFYFVQTQARFFYYRLFGFIVSGLLSGVFSWAPIKSSVSSKIPCPKVFPDYMSDELLWKDSDDTSMSAHRSA